MPPNDSDPQAAFQSYPLKLEPSFRERLWGDEDISFLYPCRPAQPSRVGEVWLTADDNRVLNGDNEGKTLGEICRAHGPALLGRPVSQLSAVSSIFPLLVKFLFTRDKLSMQVHPSDRYARAKEGSLGKTEMWHVLNSEPGARVAIGFREEFASRRQDREALRNAIESGAVESMMNWIDARPGDTFFVPAGTVHAIGAGLVICEIQQNSDVTYRLYDYKRMGTDGRPRELHVEKALDVIEWQTSGGRTGPLQLDAAQGTRLCLAACPYFATEKLMIETPAQYAAAGRCEVWVGLEGKSEFEAAGKRASCRSGEVVLIPASSPGFSVTPLSPCVFLRTYQPDLEAEVIAPLRARGFSKQQLRSVCFS